MTYFVGRDSQRSRVYAWEQQYRARVGRLSLETCEHIVKQAYYCFDLTFEGTVRSGRGHTARGGVVKVTLPDWARTDAVVLHEAAHGITYMLAGYTVAAHGPEFVRVLTELFGRFGVEDSEHARRAARAAGVLVASEYVFNNRAQYLRSAAAREA